MKVAGYRWDKKPTTGDMLELSISWLAKNEYIKEGIYRSGGLTWTRTSMWGEKTKIASISYVADMMENSYIELIYTHNKTEELKYKVCITTTNPNYGGVRYWFICPRCGERVGFLYGGKYFLCRKCQNLCYETQQINFACRMMEKGRKLLKRAKKGGECYGKPKGMHWKTYETLTEEGEYYENLGLMTFTGMADKIMEKIKNKK